MIIMHEIHREVDLIAWLNLLALAESQRESESDGQDLPLINDTYSFKIPL
jgi:hypothetical protein